MGVGEHTGSAIGRPQAEKFEEIAHGHSSAGSGSNERRRHPSTGAISTDASEWAIDPLFEHFSDYGISMSELREATYIASCTGRTAGEELIRSGIINRSDFALIAASHHDVIFSQNGPRPDLISQNSLKMTAKPNGPHPVEPDGDFCDVATEYRGWQEKPGYFLACEPEAYGAIGNIIKQAAEDRTQISLTTRKALHHAQFVARRDVHLNNAINGLS